MPSLIKENRMTVEKAEQILNSWLGHANHADSRNFIEFLIEKYNFLYLKKKNNKLVFKINTRKLEVFVNAYN